MSDTGEYAHATHGEMREAFSLQERPRPSRDEVRAEKTMEEKNEMATPGTVKRASGRTQRGHRAQMSRRGEAATCGGTSARGA
jgi:hypothetical protein